MNRRSCPDAAIPGPDDPIPWVAFRGDTLLVLVQDVETGLGARTVLRRYVVDADDCRWMDG